MNYLKNIYSNCKNTTANIFNILFFVIALLYFSVMLHIPISININSVHDDAHFWAQAQNILTGNWLGSYSQMTLIKGPFFPIFLAINKIIGINIIASIALLYIASIYFLIITLENFKIKKVLLIILAAILLFHPAIFPIRIIRDDIYFSLTIFFIISFSGLLYPKIILKQNIYIIILGVSSFAFFATREEGVWLIPSLVFSYILRLAYLRKNKDINSIKIISLNLLKSFLLSFFIIFIICAVNFSKYKQFNIVDFTSNPYKSALNIIQSVQVANPIDYVPMQLDKRRIVYEISPTFKKLENYFEVSGKGWTLHGCSVYPQSCGEYAGGWFMWAFRDAVASIGGYKSSEDSSKTYENIKSEVEAACMSGKIKCRSNLIPFLPYFSENDFSRAKLGFLKALDMLLLRIPIPINSPYSSGSLDELNLVRNFLGGPLINSTKNQSISSRNFIGWYYPGNSGWFNLECSGDKESSSTKHLVPRLASEDLIGVTNDQKMSKQRFNFFIKSETECQLVSEDKKYSIALDALQNQAIYIKINNGVGVLYFDLIKESPGLEMGKNFYTIKNYLFIFYKNFIIFGLALFLLSFGALIKGKKFSISNDPVCTFWLICLIGLISRICILVIIDSTSFPALHELYMYPSYVLFILVIFLPFCRIMGYSKLTSKG